MQKKTAMRISFRILLALLPLFLFWLFLAATPPLAYADQDAADYIWTRRFADSSHSPSYDVVFLGDSLANTSYIPNFFPGRTANLSVMGASPAHEYHILRRYLENNVPPKTCYVSFSDHLLDTDRDFLSPATAQLFTFSETRALMAEGRKRGLKFKAVPDYPAWEFYFFSPRVYQLSFVRGLLSDRKKSNMARLHHADIHAGAYMQPVTASFGSGESVHDSFSIAPLNESYYRKIIELCIANGIQVRLVKLPSHPAVGHTENYRKDFAEYYGTLKADYPEITVDWFEYGLAEDCFVDTIGHVNLTGGYAFSTMLSRFYPGDFDRSSPPAGELVAGLEEYRQAGFDPSQAEPAGELVDIFGD